MANKAKSFTLSELLVVMIITIIVVGIAFSVLSLVQRQIHSIRKNFAKTTELSLFEQRLWQDFNTHSDIIYIPGRIQLISDIDTVRYHFSGSYTLIDHDTIPVTLVIDKAYYRGQQKASGKIDAISVSAVKELPDYSIFVSTQLDAAHFMNTNGF